MWGLPRRSVVKSRSQPTLRTLSSTWVRRSVGRGLGRRDQPLGLRRQQGKRDPANTVDVDRGHENLPLAADAIIARPIDRPETIEQGITDRRHDHSVPAGRAAATPNLARGPWLPHILAKADHIAVEVAHLEVAAAIDLVFRRAQDRRPAPAQLGMERVDVADIEIGVPGIAIER